MTSQTGTPNRVTRKDPLPPAARGLIPPNSFHSASQESVDLLNKRMGAVETMLAKILSHLESLSPSLTPPPSLPSLSPMINVAREVYEACTKATSDLTEYATKECRAVVIGSTELKNHAEGLKRDEKMVTDLVDYCGSEEVKKALASGGITYHSHPKDRPPHARPLKIEFKSKDIRDSFLVGIRSKPGRPPPLISPSSLVRKDLTPTQLQLERDARKEAVKRNTEAKQIIWGVRDYSLISYRNPRPLPPHYGIPRASRYMNPTADRFSPDSSSSLSEVTARDDSPPPSNRAQASDRNVTTRRAAAPPQ